MGRGLWNRRMKAASTRCKSAGEKVPFPAKYSAILRDSMGEAVANWRISSASFAAMASICRTSSVRATAQSYSFCARSTSSADAVISVFAITPRSTSLFCSAAVFLRRSRRRFAAATVSAACSTVRSLPYKARVRSASSMRSSNSASACSSLILGRVPVSTMIRTRSTLRRARRTEGSSSASSAAVGIFAAGAGPELAGAEPLGVWADKTAAAAVAANRNLRFKALLIVYDSG